MTIWKYVLAADMFINMRTIMDSSLDNYGAISALNTNVHEFTRCSKQQRLNMGLTSHSLKIYASIFVKPISKTSTTVADLMFQTLSRHLLTPLEVLQGYLHQPHLLVALTTLILKPPIRRLQNHYHPLIQIGRAHV